MSSKLTLGNFTGLGENYANNRPDYSEVVLHAAFGLIGKIPSEVTVADVGAGTGIWTRMISNAGVPLIQAIEPNLDMRMNAAPGKNEIHWINGSAEDTTLPNESVDWLTMASSFHWADFEKALNEFHRVLKPNGWFTALWNPRHISGNPLFEDIEIYIKEKLPNLTRISSGKSGITETLTERLESSPYFKNVTYLESKHTIVMSTDRYIGAWLSVNDLQVKFGEDGFKDFIDFIKIKLSGLTQIETTYLTRAWFAQKKVV